MKTYTIKEMSKEFNVDHQVIRRRISKLNIKADNEDTREFKNTPLEYSQASYNELAKEFIQDESILNTDKVQETNDKINNKQQQVDDNSKDKLIEILDRELQDTKKRLDEQIKNDKDRYNNLLILFSREQQDRQSLSNELETLKLDINKEDNQVYTVYDEQDVEEDTPEPQTKTNLFSKLKSILKR